MRRQKQQWESEFSSIKVFRFSFLGLFPSCKLFETLFFQFELKFSFNSLLGKTKCFDKIFNRFFYFKNRKTSNRRTSSKCRIDCWNRWKSDRENWNNDLTDNLPSSFQIFSLILTLTLRIKQNGCWSWPSFWSKSRSKGATLEKFIFTSTRQTLPIFGPSNRIEIQ